MNSAVKYSVIAPLYNESGNLRPLYERLKPVLDSLAGGAWELILVDDGSRDDSWQAVQALHRQDSRVLGIRFSRNFGHHIALTAGLDASRGDRVVTMDSDLQDQPEELPKLAAKMDAGYDLVYAERTGRQHSAAKQMGSRTFLWLLNSMSAVPYPITGAVFRMMNRKVVNELCRMRERHRLFTGLTAWVGFKQTAVAVVHGERFSGETKYDFAKMLKLAADSITAFSAKPLLYVVYVGAAVAAAAALFGIYIVVRYYTIGFSTAGYASILAAVVFFGGANLFTIGVIGQYIARIFEEAKGRPVYIIEDAIQAMDSPSDDRTVNAIPGRFTLSGEAGH